VVTAGGETAKLPGGLEVLPLALHFVEAPPYALPAAPDGGAPATITGAALGDFDGDGAPDLITCAAECRFLRNDGRGNFTDSPDEKSSPRFPGGAFAARSVLAMDFDGDGDLDLFLGLDASGPGALYVKTPWPSFT
jgi:hypothetical protein